jgi:hypothetical protein
MPTAPTSKFVKGAMVDGELLVVRVV